MADEFRQLVAYYIRHVGRAVEGWEPGHDSYSEACLCAVIASSSRRSHA